MSLTIEAIYEDGVLKPNGPLPLKEHEQVEIVIRPKMDVAQSSYGIIGWKGDHETLERLLAEAEEQQ